jgi:hypothetical protein
MINYKSFKLPGNAKLRVRTENIVATVSSKDKNSIDLYIAELANPFHIPITDDECASKMMDYIWERPEDIDKGD